MGRIEQDGPVPSAGARGAATEHAGTPGIVDGLYPRGRGNSGAAIEWIVRDPDLDARSGRRRPTRDGRDATGFVAARDGRAGTRALAGPAARG